MSEGKEGKTHRGLRNKVVGNRSGSNVCSNQGEVTVMRPWGLVKRRGKIKGGGIGVSRLNQ